MTTFFSARRAAVPVAAATLLLSATVLSGVSEAASLPKYSMPKVFGTTFQADPHHDFTKHISPRHDGILRGKIRYMQTASVAEYVPVKWVKASGHTKGHFAIPPEGDVTAYAATIAKKVVFLSATGCDGRHATADRLHLGTKQCSRELLVARGKKGGRPAMIWTVKGQIVKVVEIHTP